jgi:hypothetical protein
VVIFQVPSDPAFLTKPGTHLTAAVILMVTIIYRATLYLLAKESRGTNLSDTTPTA